jgi:hypothetical protein
MGDHRRKRGFLLRNIVGAAQWCKGFHPMTNGFRKIRDKCRRPHPGAASDDRMREAGVA